MEDGGGEGGVSLWGGLGGGVEVVWDGELERVVKVGVGVVVRLPGVGGVLDVCEWRVGGKEEDEERVMWK